MALALLLVAGAITGRVELPPAAPAPPRSDPACPAAAPAAAGALVRIAVGELHGPAPAAPAIVDQRACDYAPRVLGIVAGQKLVVRNSDPTVHNVHTPDVNYAQPRGAPDLVLTVPTPPGDQPYRLACDIHPWMEAVVWVTDHPYFTVTAPDGTFALDNVPPGIYTVEVLLPRHGKRTAKVTVKAGRTTAVELPPYQGKP